MKATARQIAAKPAPGGGTASPAGASPTGASPPGQGPGEGPHSGPAETNRTAPRRRQRFVRARLAAVSVRAAMNAGALVGLAIGLVLGAVTGAMIVWFSGAVLDWQRQLSLTLGITQTLLPFGDQTGNLRILSQNWFLVIPAAGVVGGLLLASIGGLVGGLAAASYNRTTRQTSVLVESDPEAEGKAPGAE
jgi:hypothetical protein